MQRQIITTYNWMTSEGDDIDPEHEIQLEDHAEEHITDMMQGGFTEGELLQKIDGIDYRGEWYNDAKTIA